MEKGRSPDQYHINATKEATGVGIVQNNSRDKEIPSVKENQ